MKDFTTLKQAIAAAIQANGVGAITGPVLQEQLLAMVDKMELSSFEGVATTETTPTTDQLGEHFYLTTTTGTYDNFNGEVVEEGDIYLFYKLKDETEWTSLNLASGLQDKIAAIESGKQATLTQGTGITISDNEISVNYGDGLKTSGSAIAVDTTDDASANPTKVATGKAVVDYVDLEKGIVGGIAPLNSDGQIEKEYLPEDIVTYTETTDPESEEFIDEYTRILAVLYQAISDLNVTKATLATATNNANTAASNANDAATGATNAATHANDAATAASSAASTAMSAANTASSAATEANAATQETVTAIQRAVAAASTASVNAEYAQTQGDYAKAQGDYAKEQGDYADTKGDYANEQGDYAKTQGEAAQEIVDNAKGTYDTLGDRLDAMDAVDTNLEGRIGTLETTATSLDGRVDALEDADTSMLGRISALESAQVTYEEADDFSAFV